MSNKECVKVVVRCRPMNSTEREDGHKQIVKVDEKRNEIQIENMKNDG